MLSKDRDSSYPHRAYSPATETDNNHERENEVTVWHVQQRELASSVQQECLQEEVGTVTLEG